MRKIIDLLKNAVVSTTVIFAAIMLLKLAYFNSQIGKAQPSWLSIITSLGPILILGSISLLLKPKAAKLYLMILDILITIVIFSNIMFYRYFNELLSIPLLFQASNLTDIQSSMLQLVHLSDIVLSIDFIALFFFRKAVNSSDQAVSLTVRVYSFMLCCIAGMLMVFGAFTQLIKSQPTILQTFYDRVYVAQSVGLLNYHAADFYTFAQQSTAEGSKLDIQKKQELLDFFKARKQQAQSDKQLYGAAKGKNLIVVQLEAMQQFVINRTINGQEITPNLNKLAASSLYFDNYYFQTAGGGTSDAEFTANMSMFPMKEGAVYIRKPGNYYYSLPDKLKESNYSTIAFHGYKPGFWNRSVVYRNIGFDKFVSKNEMSEEELMGMGISDKSFYRQVIEQLETQQQPYYAFLISLSSHFPYDNDKSKYSSFDVGEYKDTLIGNYLEAAHYADEALGQFTNELESRGLMSNTVLAVYGDHHAIPKDNAKELAQLLNKEELSPIEWQQLQKVPLIIKVPGVEGKAISIVGGGVDFMPTMLNILGIEDKNMPSFGRDLLNSSEGLAVLRNGSFVTDDKLYISSENSCYSIATGEALSIEQYREMKLEAEKLLNYSDTMISFDLVKEVRKYLEDK